MAKNKEKLIEYARGKGIELFDPNALSCEQIQDLIREKVCEGRDLLPQLEVMKAKDAKDFVDYNSSKFWITPEMNVKFWNSKEWIVEEKLDGAHFKMHFTKNGIRFDSRRRSEVDYAFSEKTGNFPQFTKYNGVSWIKDLEGTVLDGEILMDYKSIDTGTNISVGTLASTMSVANSHPEVAIKVQEKCGFAKFIVHDILFLRKEDVRKQPYEWRRLLYTKVVDILRMRDVEDIYFVEGVTADEMSLDKYFEQCIEKGLEGSMFKKLSGVYESGVRSKNIWKLKRFITLDGFVCGFVPGEGANEGMIGSVEVGGYDQFGKVHVFAAPQNFDRETRRNMSNEDGSLKQECYDEVVEVRGQEITKQGRLRHPVILRYRPELQPTDCQLFVDLKQNIVRQV